VWHYPRKKWIMILGDDDILEKNVVEQFYNHLSKFEKMQCNSVFNS
jgi:hypothetical protein